MERFWSVSEYLTFCAKLQTVLDDGSHGSHTCPWTDAYNWGPGVAREGDKSSRDPNKDGIAFRQDQQIQDATTKTL